MRYLTQRSQITKKMPESYLKFDAVKNSNLNNNDPIIMYLQYDETHHL